ncbi:MAG: hypothetical protein ACI9LM_002447 [Alteromonadaceae bacterium]
MPETKYFVDDLINKAVILEVVGGQLKIDGPASVLNDTTCDKLRRLKPKIIDYIRLQEMPAVPEKSDIIAVSPNKAFPLSYTQLCFWFVYFALGETANNLSRLMFKSRVKPADLEKALHQLVRKYTIFNVSIGELVPVQRLKASPLPPLEVTELQAFDRVQQNDMVSKDVTDLMRPFDISAPPLVRYHYYQLTKDESLLVCCFPHIVLDGAAVHLFEQELIQALSNDAEVLKSEPDPLSHYILAQRKIAKDVYAAQLAFWQNSLAGFRRAQFPANYINQQNKRYVDREIVIPEKFLAQVQQCCVKKRVSMQMVIIAIICQTIRSITAEQRLVVNSVMENRISDDEEKLMAPILYLLPTPVEMLSADNFNHTLDQIRKHNKIAQDNMDISFSVPQGIIAAERWRGINKPLASMIKAISRMLSFLLPSAQLFPSYWSDYFLTENPPFVTKNTSQLSAGTKEVYDPVININLLPNTYKHTHSQTDGSNNISSLSDKDRFLPKQSLDGDWEAGSIDFYVSKDSSDKLVFRVTCCCLNDSGIEKIEQELQQRMSEFVA